MSRAVTVALTVTLAVTLAASSAGCFSSWVLTQSFGTQRVLDERAREEVVPLPGVVESLQVGLPLERRYRTTAAATPPGTGSPPGPDGSSPVPPEPSRSTPRAVVIQCSSQQRGTDAVYRSAFRYGSRWKKMTAFAFALEAAAGAALLLATDPDSDGAIGNYLYGGLFAVDAVGTAALFFVPRKEIYRRTERPISTVLREDCPDGLVLEVAGDAFPINAAGGIGELAEAAIDAWMHQPAGAILVSFEGRTSELRIGVAEQCMWQRSRDPGHAPACAAVYVTPPAVAITTFDVPLGTLSQIAAPPADPAEDPSGAPSSAPAMVP